MNENESVENENSQANEPLTFNHFEWREPLKKILAELNYNQCTPIQEQSFGYILDGKDLAGLAQTGTGKTAAFLLPLIERMLCSQLPEKNELETNREFKDWVKGNFVLILVPTRELATQVVDNISKFVKYTDLTTSAFFGGVGYDKQIEALQAGCQLVVGTPGRFIDLYKEGHVDLKLVRAVVFDEADRMFDMGFKDDMKFLLQRMPKDRQMLLFSATLNLDVLNTAYQFGAEPIEINVSRDQATAENVDDKIFHVGSDEKPAYLLSLLKKHNPAQCIVFSNFKHNVDRISQFLNNNGCTALGISSLLNQSQRTRVMKQFKTDHTHNILIATDVAARGLDIKGVDMVINMELPDDAENYVHRIGRTGRASSKGIAFSLVSDRDVDSLTRIEDYLKKKLEAGWLEDAEIIKEFTSMKDVERFSDFKDENRPRPQREDRGGRQGGGKRFSRGNDRGFDRDRGGNGRDFRKDRDQNRDHHRGENRFSKSREGGPEKFKDQDSPVHRDKRTSGRHTPNSGGRPNEKFDRKDSARGHNKNFKGKQNPSHAQKHPGQRYDKNRAVSRPSKVAAKPTGLIQKITSTISSWFK